MNKQEALKQIEQQKEAILQMQSLAFYGYIEGLVKQLDEPHWAFDKAQKVNSNSQLYKQAGNSVTVNVIEAIAKRIKVEDN